VTALWGRHSARANEPRRIRLREFALTAGEVVLSYRTTLDLWTNEIAGVEACRSGGATTCSERAVGKAIAQCGKWRRHGVDLPVAVNVDTRTLIAPDLPRRLAQLLEDHDVPPEQIELEIPEKSLAENPLLIRRVAIELEQLGMELSIGSFGTGYSSLSCLSQLSISKLKIDRSLVGGIAESESQRIIVRATIDHAHSLGLAVVVDGVDDERTLRVVRALGGDYAQGVHVGLPVPADCFVGASSTCEV
jgi:EAL domain-containing protein (putative c-di-GMP-specific phosphodiesterase class I)